MLLVSPLLQQLQSFRDSFQLFHRVLKLLALLHWFHQVLKQAFLGSLAKQPIVFLLLLQYQLTHYRIKVLVPHQRPLLQLLCSFWPVITRFFEIFFINAHAVASFSTRNIASLALQVSEYIVFSKVGVLLQPEEGLHASSSAYQDMSLRDEVNLPHFLVLSYDFFFFFILSRVQCKHYVVLEPLGHFLKKYIKRFEKVAKQVVE